MTLWWWPLVARAASPAPEFAGATPADTKLLAVAWQEVARCTGWDAPQRGRIDVSYAQAGSQGAQGHARVMNGVVDAIVLHSGYGPATVVHEVAHAWVSFRPHTPRALDEGLTELLRECVARNRPDLALSARTIEGTERVDLWSWKNAGSAQDEDVAYDASLLLARAAADVVGERQLWPDPATPFLDWFWFSEALARVPPSPAHWKVLEALGPSAEVGDLDGDGVTTRDERVDGTIPWDWDSDDDGGPDGQARRSEKQILLSVDGTPVCSGSRAKDDAAQFAFGADVDVQAPGALAPSIPAVAVRAGDALYLSAPAVPPRGPRRVHMATLESSRGLERDPSCPVAGRRTLREASGAFHAVFVRPPADVVERWIQDAMKAGHEFIGVSGDRSHVPVDSVRDVRSAARAVAWGWVPEQNTMFQRARAGAVTWWIEEGLGLRQETQMLTSSERIVFAEVAGRPASNPDAESLMAGWLERVANRLTRPTVLADETFPAIVTRLRSYPDDSVLRALDELAHKPFWLTDGWPQPVGPRTITQLRADQVWQCSGWRSAGNPPFDVSIGGNDGTMDLPVWTSDGRVVHGVGQALELWRAGGIRDGESCGEAPSLVWVTTSLRPAPPKLLAAWSAERRRAKPISPVAVQLGGPSTRQWNGGVIVSDALLAWGSSSGRWDVVAAAMGVLVDATAYGTVIEESHLREELVPRFGADLPVLLGPQGD